MLGLTLASLFPNRVERVVVNGIIDLDDYYSGRWDRNLQDTDHVVGKLPEGCANAGPERCGLFEPTPFEVEARVERLLAKVKTEPVPVLSDSGEPDWVTDGDATAVILDTVYDTPVSALKGEPEAPLRQLQARLFLSVRRRSLLGLPKESAVLKLPDLSCE